MKTNKKASFFDNMTPVGIELDENNITYINDRRFFLHRIVWSKDDTFPVVLDKCSKYLKTHYDPTEGTGQHPDKSCHGNEDNKESYVSGPKQAINDIYVEISAVLANMKIKMSLKGSLHKGIKVKGKATNRYQILQKQTLRTRYTFS